MYSVLGNHKTMTHRYTVNVIHVYSGIIVFTQHKLFLYADDSALLTSSSDVSEIEDVLSTELESVSEWLVENCLSLHMIALAALMQLKKKSCVVKVL